MDLKQYYKAGDEGGEFASEFEERVERVVEWSSDVSGVILDIGCSDGRIAARFKAPQRHVYGVDLDLAQLREAQRLLPGALTFDITTPWPVRAGSLAGVHMGAVIEHVFDFRTLFAEAAKALSPQGRLWISTPNMACIRHRVEVAFGLMPLWYTNFEHIRPWTIDWLDTSVAPLGLRRTRFAGAHIRTSPLHRMISKFLPRLSSLFVAEYRRIG